MPLKSRRAWLRLDTPAEGVHAPLRGTPEAVAHLEPERARYPAAFAYRPGRVAHADHHVSPEGTRAMVSLVQEHGQVSPDQVRLAPESNHVFGGAANVCMAREFFGLATYDQKLALVGCLFALQATLDAISTAEEGELHRIANGLRIQHADLVRLGVAHRQHLPGLSRGGWA